MDAFLAFCKKQQKKQRNIVLGIFLLFIVILYLLWGPKVINYMRGAEEFQKIDFYNYDDNQAFFRLSSLENRYAEESLSWISPGIADRVKNLETVGIYYLYMMNNDKYMVIYADKSVMQDTENLYYNNISTDKKALTVSIQGGFEELDNDVKEYAYEYLHGIDANKYGTMEAVDEVILPYVFVSNQLGGSSFFFIKGTFYVFLAFLILIPLFMFIDLKLIALKPTMRNLQLLSDADKLIVDKEFQEGKRVHHYIISSKLLFYRYGLQYRILNYDDILWMYKQKNNLDIMNLYCLWIYMKDGSRYRMVLGNDHKKANKIVSRIHNQNYDMLYGYQVQLVDKYNVSMEGFLKMIEEMKTKEKKDNEKV